MVLLLENEMVRFPNEGSHTYRHTYIMQDIRILGDPDEVVYTLQDLNQLNFMGKIEYCI